MPLDLSSDVVDLAEAICDIESESGNERALADAIQDSLSECTHLEVTRLGNAVIARTDIDCARRIVIAGHIDTVPVSNNLPVSRKTIEGVNVLWGRGTVDMKAGVAVQLKLAHDLDKPSANLTWVFYDNEEVAASLNGLGRIVSKFPELLEADFAILCEPTNGLIEGGCNGTLRAEVRATGRRAHSARSWMGVNAIHELAPALDRLACFMPESIEVDGLTYREGLNAVAISGGFAGNVIPDEAVLTVNYRFAPSRSIDDAKTIVVEVFDGYEVVFTDQAAGARPGLDSEIAIEFASYVEGSPMPKYGWTDVARFSALGIPAVNFGPGDPSLAHADDERVSIHQVRSCELTLRNWLTARP